MNEEWRLISESECYEVSNFGEIKSIASTSIRKDGKKYTHKAQKIKPFTTRTGYVLVPLKRDVNKKKLVHRLVMEAFKPMDKMEELQVNHIDGNKSNNRLDNLEWCTRKENMGHAFEKGLWKPDKRRGELHPMSELTESDVIEIKKMIKSKEYKQCEIAKIFSVSDTTISEIKTGRKWCHVK